MSQRKRKKTHTNAPACVIAHSTAGRIRLSFPQFKGKAEEFVALCEACLALPDVIEAEGRTRTGSLVLKHTGEAEALIKAASDLGVFLVKAAEAAPEPEEEPAAEWLLELLAALKQEGPANPRNLAALAFFLMAIRQVFSGKIMPPAATALMTGIELAMGPGGFAASHWTSEAGGSDDSSD